MIVERNDKSTESKTIDDSAAPLPFDFINVKTGSSLHYVNNCLCDDASLCVAQVCHLNGRNVFDFRPECSVYNGAYKNSKNELVQEKLKPTGIPISSCYKTKILARELKKISPGNVAFDLGCSNCGVLHFLPENIVKIGVDISIDSLFNRKPNALDSNVKNIIICNAAELPIPDAVADTILCCDIIEHSLEPESILAEAYRILKPNGTLVVSVPNLVHLANRLSILFGYGGGIELAQLLKFKSPFIPINGVRFPDQRLHLRWFTSASLKRLLEDCGFRIVRQFGIGPIVSKTGLAGISKNLALLTAAIAVKP